jgi:hypothetical protein
MKITYAITVCNEFIEIQRLIRFLLENKRIQDNIVVLYDAKNGDFEIESFLRANSINGEFSWHKGEFEGHFADWKNKLSSYCFGDYIFQIDADEIPNKTLIEQLPNILETNSTVDVMLVPRVNTVEGIDQDHMQQWGWNVNDHGWINWPDYQWRIYRNDDTITWKNKVHEVLQGFTKYATLPIEEDYSLYHPKTIEKQIKQNNLYSKLG